MPDTCSQGKPSTCNLLGRTVETWEKKGNGDGGTRKQDLSNHPYGENSMLVRSPKLAVAWSEIKKREPRVNDTHGSVISRFVLTPFYDAGLKGEVRAREGQANKPTVIIGENGSHGDARSKKAGSVQRGGGGESQSKVQSALKPATSSERYSTLRQRRSGPQGGNRARRQKGCGRCSPARRQGSLAWRRGTSRRKKTIRAERVERALGGGGEQRQRAICVIARVGLRRNFRAGEPLKG